MKIRIELSTQDFAKLWGEALENESGFLYEVLSKKIDSLAEREFYFNAFKNTEITSEQREAARRKYCESKNIPYN